MLNRQSIIDMLLGIVGSLITAFLLNIFDIIEIRFPKTKQLNSHSEILAAATDLITLSDKAVYISTDVPAMGVISNNTEFRNYAAALQVAKSRELKSNQLIDVVWLKPKEEEFIAEIENLSEEHKIFALRESNELRQALKDASVRERTIPSLMFFRFWTGEAHNGNVASVISFSKDIGLNSGVKGFYTNSSEVHEILKDVQNIFASDVLEEKFLSSYSKIMGCNVPNSITKQSTAAMVAQ